MNHGLFSIQKALHWHGINQRQLEPQLLWKRILFSSNLNKNSASRGPSLEDKQRPRAKLQVLQEAAESTQIMMWCQSNNLPKITFTQFLLKSSSNIVEILLPQVEHLNKPKFQVFLFANQLNAKLGHAIRILDCVLQRQPFKNFSCLNEKRINISEERSVRLT